MDSTTARLVVLEGEGDWRSLKRSIHPHRRGRPRRRQWSDGRVGVARGSQPRPGVAPVGAGRRSPARLWLGGERGREVVSPATSACRSASSSLAVPCSGGRSGLGPVQRLCRTLLLDQSIGPTYLRHAAAQSLEMVAERRRADSAPVGGMPLPPDQGKHSSLPSERRINVLLLVPDQRGPSTSADKCSAGPLTGAFVRYSFSADARDVLRNRVGMAPSELVREPRRLAA